MSKRIPNISIEKFAAYLDNNLSAGEMAKIEHIAGEDDVLRALFDLNDAVDNGSLDNDFELPLEVLDDSIGIPDVNAAIPDDFDLAFGEFNEILQEADDRFLGKDTLYGKDGTDANDLLARNSESLEVFEEMENSYRTIGESGENIYDPLFIKQPDDHSCGLKCQQIILRDYGVDIPFDDLEQIATESGIYFDYGTKIEDLGKALEMANVGTHKLPRASIYDLTSELAQGHRVVVSVDSKELWHNDSMTGKMKNWFSDVFGEQGGNHALIVAGIEVNSSHPDDVKVVLTDSGSGQLRIEYPLDQFVDAWKDSNFFMMATNEAAPYRFDSKTGMEVPSGFASGYHCNQFVIDNGYQLRSDGLLLPSDYHPTFTGHLNRVGNLTYEEFLTRHFPADSVSQVFLGEGSESAGSIGSGDWGNSNESIVIVETDPLNEGDETEIAEIDDSPEDDDGFYMFPYE